MAVKRRDVRESAFILSFEMLFRDDSIDEIFEAAKMIDDIVLNDDVRALVSGIMDKQDELDAMISKYSKNRAIVRIPRINVAVLRLAIYEALYDEEAPDGEYIVLAFDEDNIRFDFFLADPSSNLIREVYTIDGEEYSTMYRAIFEDKDKTAVGIMQKWCEQLAEVQ